MQLAQMERIATRLDHELLTRERPSKWDDIAELSALLYSERTMKQQLNDVWLNGQPMNAGAGVAALEANPPGANVGANTYASTTEIALWPTTYTPIPALQVGPKAYYLNAWGTITSPATPGTMTTTARFGAITSGVSIAATPAVALTASITAGVWQLTGNLIIRNPGVAAAIITGAFRLSMGVVGGNGAESLPEDFNGVSGSCDNTAASTLAMCVSMATSTTNTTACQGVIFGSWN